ncbi:MAG TPA: lipopolysaccharide heptosyltransferase II [Candidatus Binatia bacterium]|nr:lipopolysaccharide heptosyltransferase II [Candidatus Binatia bacterium]
MPDSSPSIIHRPSFPSLRPPGRILVRGLNWLGDAVMSTPALLRLREHFPQAHITLLTDEKLADLWREHASLDAVLTFVPGENPWSLAGRLRPKTFDTALVLPNSIRSALEVWWARIPQRIGYVSPWRDWLLTHRLAPRPGYVPMGKLSTKEVKRLVRMSTPAGNHVSRFSFHASRITHQASHHIHQYLHLAAALGSDPAPLSPHLAVTSDELQIVRSKFSLGIGTRPILGLNPGAEYGPAKRWPAERFIEAALSLQKRTNCVWLLLGGQSDAPLANAICSALRPPDAVLRSSEPAPRALHNLAGKTSLRELMALLKTCRVLLTNDSGPMHVAAALGTPVVVPFGSTSPELTGPGLPGERVHHLLKSEVPCSPCFRRVCPIDLRCMAGITVERVVEAVLQALDVHSSSH